MAKNIETEVIQICAQQLGLEPSQLNEASNLEDLNCDSLDAVEIAMACEDTFKISISNEDAIQFNTVGDLIQFVRGKV